MIWYYTVNFNAIIYKFIKSKYYFISKGFVDAFFHFIAQLKNLIFSTDSLFKSEWEKVKQAEEQD